MIRRASKEQASAEIPIDYQIPFEWGSLVVTKEADKIYGLAAWNANLSMGSPEAANLGVKPSPHITFNLLGPEELQAKNVEHDRDKVEYTFRSPIYNELSITAQFANNIQQDQLDIDVALCNDRFDKQSIRHAIALGNDMTHGEIESYDNEGQPLDQVLEQEANQALIQALTEVSAISCRIALTEWLQEQSTRNFLFANVYSMLGGVAVAVPLGVFTVDSVLDGSAKETIMASAIAGSVLGAAVIAKLSRDMRKQLKDQASLIRNHVAWIENLTGSVRKDIESTYSSKYFNEALRSLGDDQALGS